VDNREMFDSRLAHMCDHNPRYRPLRLKTSVTETRKFHRGSIVMLRCDRQDVADVRIAYRTPPTSSEDELHLRIGLKKPPMRHSGRPNRLCFGE
jgi:hypothetical protein